MSDGSETDTTCESGTLFKGSFGVTAWLYVGCMNIEGVLTMWMRHWSIEKVAP
jgi:hypothetical protein